MPYLCRQTPTQSSRIALVGLLGALLELGCSGEEPNPSANQGGSGLIRGAGGNAVGAAGAAGATSTAGASHTTSTNTAGGVAGGTGGASNVSTANTSGGLGALGGTSASVSTVTSGGTTTVASGGTGTSSSTTAASGGVAPSTGGTSSLSGTGGTSSTTSSVPVTGGAANSTGGFRASGGGGATGGKEINTGGTRLATGGSAATGGQATGGASIVQTTGGSTAFPRCDDGVRNGAETDIDCGARCPEPCEIGAKCTVNSDCVGIGTCVSGRCSNPASVSPLTLPKGSISDIIRDPIDGAVYVSVAPRDIASIVGGQVMKIMPGSQTPAWSIPIDIGTPSLMAVGDDGRQLYVSLNLGSGGVVRIDTQSLEVKPPFSLGNYGSDGEAFATSLAVVPGDSDTLAASIRSPSTTEFSGVHLYRNGVDVRAGQPIGDWQTNTDVSWNDITSITFADSSTLYAYDGNTSEYGLGKIQLLASGLRVSQFSPLVVLGFEVNIVHNHGKLFASSGQIIDPERLSALGTLPAMGGMAVAPSGSRVYFLHSTNDAAAQHFYIDCFDPLTYTRSGAFVIDSVVNLPPATSWGKFALWGDAGLAVQLRLYSQGDLLVLLPDVLSRVHGCSPLATEPVLRPSISQPDLSLDGINLYALDARWLTPDPSSGALYVSVGSVDPRYPNSVVRFPVNTEGSVDWSVPIGSEPGPLALSDDGTRAWVALNGAAVVVPVDTATSTALPPVSLGYLARWGAIYGRDIESIPGTRTSFAIAGQYLNSTALPGVQIFDGASSRYPWVASPWSALAHVEAEAIEFVDANRIIAVNRQQKTLLELGATSLNAITFVDSFAEQVQVSSGLTLDDRGQLTNTTDLATAGQITYLGRMLNIDTQELRYFKISKSGRRLYDVGQDSGASAVECIDAATRATTAKIPIPFDPGFTYELEFFGERGLAVRVDGALAIIPEALSTPGCEP